MQARVFLNMGGLIPLYQTMVHVIHHKHSQVPCKHSVLTIITTSPHYPQSNGLAEKYVQIVKCLFNKAKEEGKYFYKSLMIYHDAPLTGSLQSPMQLFQDRSARSDLPISNAARKQLRIQHEVLRNIDMHEVLPTHDLNVGQSVMYQYSVTK